MSHAMTMFTSAPTLEVADLQSIVRQVGRVAGGLFQASSVAAILWLLVAGPGFLIGP